MSEPEMDTKKDYERPYVGVRDDRYYAVCPVCEWESSAFSTPDEAEQVAAVHDGECGG